MPPTKVRVDVQLLEKGFKNGIILSSVDHKGCSSHPPRSNSPPGHLKEGGILQNVESNFIIDILKVHWPTPGA